MAAKDEKTQLHIAMFPWLAFGHILPFLQLSKLIAQKGHKISFISTPRNIDRLPKLPANLASSFTLVKIPLPKLAGLPENAEATVDIPVELMDDLKIAFDAMQPGLTRFLEASRPDWIICDFAPHWLPPIASGLGIPTAMLMIYGAHFLGFVGSTDDLVNNSDYRTKPEDYMDPPKWVKFNTQVALRRFEANQMVEWRRSSGSGISDYVRAGKVIMGSEAILLRDSYEFEAEWLAVVQELHQKPVVPVGLLPPTDDHSDKDDETIRSWLDSQDQGSVVYVALGSEVRPSQDQLTELAHGLDLSGVHFFLNLRGYDSAELPPGFEERVSGRGIVWRSWAPQMKILSHDSVGGFLTHCGWSSVIEALMFGMPLIGLPFMHQNLTARVVCQHQIGVEIPRNEDDGSFTRDSVAHSVKLVMLENEGKKCRDKAKELSPLFCSTELQSGYVDKLIDFLKNHKRC